MLRHISPKVEMIDENFCSAVKNLQMVSNVRSKMEGLCYKRKYYG